jgi:hypothetical protein
MKFRLLSILLVCLPLVACGKTVHWKQEVLLQDGRVIIVERISEQTGKLFPENVSMEKFQVIEFENPDTHESISWEIPKGLLPHTLDFDNKTPYLVLSAYTVADYNNWNCPNPPFLVYRYESSHWRSISFGELPEKIEMRNLFDMSKMYRKYATSEVASLSDMKKFLARIDPEHRVIGREKISAIAEGCDPDTLVRLGRQSEINYRR